MSRIIKGLLCLVLVVSGLCGCQDSSEQQEDSLIIASATKGQYAKKMPYELSGARYWHGTAMSRFDAIEVEKGLERLVQEYFSTKEYLESAGLLLDASDVQMLQRRESEDYPYGLNPSLGTFAITDAISVESPYLIYDIAELNFYRAEEKEELAGIALAILMNSTVTTTQDGVETTITIPTERLYTVGSNAGRKLERYMRQLTGVDADCPIYIALYASGSANSSVPGVFIGEAYFTGRSGQFTTINEEWALFPSDLAQSLDATLYSQFVSIKDSIHDFLPESVDMTGLGRFEDEQIRSLKITVNVQAKTYSEISALAQLLASLCDSLDTSQMDLSIEVKMFDQTYFTMVKNQGESTMSIHDMS